MATSRAALLIFRIGAKMATWSCCLQAAPGEGADRKRISLPLCPITDSVVRPIQQVEDALERHLSFEAVDADNGSSDEEGDNMLPDPVQFVPNEDGHLLKCRRPTISRDNCPAATIFGVEENASLYRQRHMSESNIDVEMTIYRPTLANNGKEEGCCCDHPMGDWNRNRNRKEFQSGGSDSSNGSSNCIANLRVVDFTRFQLQRRSECAATTSKPIFSSPGNVCHLIRSVMKCPRASHCASPWSSRYITGTCSQETISSISSCQHRDQTVALLVLGHPNGTQKGEGEWDKVESKELSGLVKFRVGDASPSYHLHSVSKLSMPKNADVLSLFDASSATGSSDTIPVTMLVYRHLSSRRNLSATHPITGAAVENSQDPYYLWETFQPPKVDDTNDPMLTKVQEEEPPPPQHRLVAPPYQSHLNLYPGLLDEIMKPENIAVITDEALRIPQWTAWPEKNHYSSPDDDNDEGDGESKGNEDSPYPATWTVFPLCHTFPANIVENRKWIGKTCNFVPRTAALLEGLGPSLRTALFSRLEPRTTLSAHTGWADLANHVLRLHIPLVVPGGPHNLGLCGTWVDGAVETHQMGEVICFDDSKVHRAFNYTDEERIVLIVDLARTDALPLGTATGGHTEELDQFIKELT